MKKFHRFERNFTKLKKRAQSWGKKFTHLAERKNEKRKKKMNKILSMKKENIINIEEKDEKAVRKHWWSGYGSAHVLVRSPVRISPTRIGFFAFYKQKQNICQKRKTETK